MTREIDTVAELEEALNALQQAEDLIAGIPDWMRELHAEYTIHREKIDVLEQGIEDAGQEHRTAEAEAEDAQEKLQHLQEQINLVRNQKEYGALLQEIDTAKDRIKLAEEQALGALERQELDQEPLDQEREAFRDLDERYAAALEKWESEKPALAREAEILRGRIEVLKERLSPGTLSIFQRIFQRYTGHALAPIREVARVGRAAQSWHCSACNYNVRPQAVVEIRNQGTIVLCDSCKRILSFDETAV